MSEMFVPIDNVYIECLTQEAIKNRRITLNTEINESEIFKAMYYMRKIKKMDDSQDIDIAKRKPIRIVCGSYGGSVYECMGLVALMEEFKELGYIIETECYTKAMSCGHMIFIHGSKGYRYLGRFATLLVHQLSNVIYGNYEQLKVSYEADSKLQRRLNEMICNNSTITLEELEPKIKAVDWYVDVDDAIKYGFADKII